MQSSDDDQQYGTSPVSVKGSPKAVSTSVGEFVLSRMPANPQRVSPTPSDDEYSNLLLNQRLEEVSLEQGSEETKIRKDRISIDSTDSVKSESSEEIDLILRVRTEQKERLELINRVTPHEIIVDAESNSEITRQIVGDMSKSSSALERQLELSELKARHDALSIRILEEQCRALSLQLQTIQNQRQVQIRESERLEHVRIASESQEKAIESELRRVGY